MKNIFCLILLPLVLFGAEPKSDPIRTETDNAPAGQSPELHPASFVGRWQCRILYQATDRAVSSMIITLKANGEGELRTEAGRTSGQFVIGTWTKAGDYLVIDGLDHNIGFVTYKVVSLVGTKLAMLDRFGKTLEFKHVGPANNNAIPPMPGATP